MGGSAGTSAERASSQNDALEAQRRGQAQQGSAATGNMLANYGAGNTSIGGALSGKSGEERQNAMSSIVNDPMAGNKLATDQVQSNPILGQMFGQGGALERTNNEEKDLASRGFQLKPEDREAYGQASGDIARMFGQTEQNGAQSLADRGLSAAPSGAAGAMFSGIQGNKNEQLAKAQTNIANQRMQNNMQRLGQTRQFMSQLSQQAGNEIGAQSARNHQGVEGAFNQGQATGQMNMNNQALQQNVNNEQFAQQQATKQKGFFEKMGDAATGALAGGVSNAVGAIADPIGTAQKMAPVAKSFLGG